MLGRSARWLASAATALFAAGCATTNPANVPDIARPDTPPAPAHTRFQEALVCMDQLYGDYGVSNVTIAVSGVPDHTGRVFVGSDTWLQTAITKMSQRSHAFVVTDFNPNPYAPEQAMFTMVRDNQRFYVPAYYIRGAISGFADDVASDNQTLAIGSAMYDGGVGANRSFSTVSVDLTIGDLVQRTLVGRATSGNEVVLRSRGVGAQFGGRFQKFGADVELSVSQRDGIPQAVRSLIEIGAIEITGRLTGVPYWSCLDGDHDDPGVAQVRGDVHANMSDPERVVFTQRRLFALGYYTGVMNGQASPELDAAIAAYAGDRGVPARPANDRRLYDQLTRWREDVVRRAAEAPAAAPA
ncbi:MAG: hypothetical protein MI723_07120, partial [Caulobacterales bacterium]|nr:hypothetical protein [Caulobacterales bacterium]